MKITLKDLRPGYYAGMPPDAWWEKWICRILGCKTFHWIWLVRPIFEKGILVDFMTSEAINKGTSITRADGRHMMIWCLKGDPRIDPDDILDIHSEYGDLPYGFRIDIWTGIWYIAQHYFGKIIPFKKFKGVNCIYWVDMASMQLGFDLVPGKHDYITELDLENSPVLEYVGELDYEHQFWGVVD